MSARQSLVALVMALVLAACSGSTSMSDDTAPAGPGPAGLQIADDGTIPVVLALTEFAAAFGPLPGVEVDVDRGTLSGSGPLRWVRNHWDSISPDQREAIDGYLAAGEPLEAASAPAMVLAANVELAGAADEPDSLALVQLATQIEDQIAARMGRDLGIPVELRIAPALVNAKALAYVTTVDASGGWQGVPVLCRITFTKSGSEIAKQISAAGVASDDLVWLMAHEVFHCFQATAGGSPGPRMQPGPRG